MTCRFNGTNTLIDPPPSCLTLTLTLKYTYRPPSCHTLTRPHPHPWSIRSIHGGGGGEGVDKCICADLIHRITKY